METPPEPEVKSDPEPQPEPLSLASIREQIAQNKSKFNAAAILRKVIHSKGYTTLTSSFNGEDALEFIEMLDNASLCVLWILGHLLIPTHRLSLTQHTRRRIYSRSSGDCVGGLAYCLRRTCCWSSLQSRETSLQLVVRSGSN